MSHHSRISAAVLALSVASAIAGSAGDPSVVVTATAPPTSSLLDDWLLLNGRLRYEYADQDGRDDSSALTWRHRAGIQTGAWAGLSALAELEHTWDLLGEDHYKFNGYADGFLSTPSSGLQDLYAYVGGGLPGGFDPRLTYHHFLSDTDHDSLGNELDLTLGHKLGEHASALLKAAYLQGDGGQPDIERLSFQIDYQF